MEDDGFMEYLLQPEEQQEQPKDELNESYASHQEGLLEASEVHYRHSKVIARRIANIRIAAKEAKAGETVTLERDVAVEAAIDKAEELLQKFAINEAEETEVVQEEKEPVVEMPSSSKSEETSNTQGRPDGWSSNEHDNADDLEARAEAAVKNGDTATKLPDRVVIISKKAATEEGIVNKTANKAEGKKVADLVGTDHPRKIGNRQEADVNDTLEAVRNLYQYETDDTKQSSVAKPRYAENKLASPVLKKEKLIGYGGSAIQGLKTSAAKRVDCSNCPLDTWLDAIVKVESRPEAECSPDARKTKTDDKVALVEEVVVVKAVQEKDAARLDYGKENLLAEVSPEIKDERLEVEVGSAKEHADRGERLVAETRAEVFRKYMEELDQFSDCNRKSLVEVRKSMGFRRQESILKVVPVEVIIEEAILITSVIIHHDIKRVHGPLVGAELVKLDVAKGPTILKSIEMENVLIAKKVVTVQTRREELEDYLRGVELHLQNLRKSLETVVEVVKVEAAAVSVVEETVEVRADQVTDTVERLTKNDLDTEQTEDNTIERPVDDCNKEDDYGYDEQSFEEELSLTMVTGEV